MSSDFGLPPLKSPIPEEKGEVAPKKEEKKATSKPLHHFVPKDLPGPKPQQKPIEKFLGGIGSFIDSFIATVKQKKSGTTPSAGEKAKERAKEMFSPEDKKDLPHKNKASLTSSKEHGAHYQIWKAFSHLPGPVVKLVASIVLSETDLSREGAIDQYPPELIPKLPAHLFSELPTRYLPLLTPSQVSQLSASQLKALGDRISEIPRKNFPFLSQKALLKLLAESKWEDAVEGRVKEMIAACKDWDSLDSYAQLYARLNIQNFWYNIGKCPYPLDFKEPKWALIALYSLPKLEQEDVSQERFSNTPTAALLSAASKGNDKLVDFLHSRMQIKLDAKGIQEMFKGCLSITYAIPEHFLSYFLPYLDSVFPNGETMLTMAVKENNPQYTKFLVESGASLALKNKEGKTAADIALEEGKWTHLKILDGNHFAAAAEGALLRCPKEELQTFVWRTFLNSDSRDVFAVLDHALEQLSKNPDQDSTEKLLMLQRLKTDLEEGGSLIARFRDPGSQSMMHFNYGAGFPNYIAQQIGYSRQRNESYRTVLQEVKNNPGTDLKRVLQMLSSNRAGDFKEFRRMESDDEGRSAYTNITGQYHQLLGHPIGVLRRHQELPLSEQIVPNQNGYLVTHKLEDGRTLELTRLDIIPDKTVWNHTSDKTLGEIFPVMQRLFKEIQSTAVKSRELTPKTEEKIALLYWMTCQAMPFARGSSQYALELHRLCYEILGYRAPPPSQEFILPDTIALSTPFDVFYREFYPKIFEGPPKRINPQPL